MPRKRTFTIDSALDGAMELFSERGYHGTTMQASAAHLKLSRSSVYFAFRAKSALFVQVLRRYTGAGRAPGLSELSGAGPPRAALGEGLRGGAGGEEERQPRALYLLIETAKGLKRREPELAPLVDETFLDMEGRFRDAIERGKAAAEIARRRRSGHGGTGATQSLLRLVCDRRQLGLAFAMPFEAHVPAL